MVVVAEAMWWLFRRLCWVVGGFLTKASPSILLWLRALQNMNKKVAKSN